MEIALAIIAILLMVIVILLMRTLLVKPTSAKTATISLENTPRAQEYGKKLSKMVQCETISVRDNQDLEKFFRFHKLLEELFPLVHNTLERQEFEGSLLYKWCGKGVGEPIILMSHQDVVEATGEWTHEPFSGDIDEEGRVWGRGTVDTKASLFCIFTAIEELIESGYEPSCDVYIASSCTEEISGMGGPTMVAYLKEKGVEPGMLIDEGGMILDAPVAGVNGLYGMVGVVEKGYADVKFVARSNGGHSSAPKKNTPLVRLGKFMVAVESHNPFKARFTPTVKEMFRRMAPNMDFGMRLIFRNLWLFQGLLIKLLPSISSAGGAMIKTTVAFTTAKGSDGLNVLPQEAYVTANLRCIQHQGTKESISLLKAWADRYNIETELIYADEPCPIVDYKERPFRLLEEVAAEVYPGVGISPYVMTGGTDAKYFSKICKNCLRFAPLYIDAQQYASVHAIDENIYQGALPNGVDFYKGVIKKWNETK